MSKKEKRATPKPAPTKRQQSKWQRQMKIRRIIIIVSVVLIATLVSVVSLAIYNDRVAPWREVVIKVNDASIRMDYYIDMLDLQSASMGDDDYFVSYIADMVVESIIESEVIRQGAESLGIVVTTAEIDARIREYEWPDYSDLPYGKLLRDMVKTEILWEKLENYFDSELLPETMEQAHVQVMLVESDEVAREVLSAIQAGGNFTTLVDEFSRHPQIGGDLGWLPDELMPNPIIADVAFNMTVGEVHGPVHDGIPLKNIGYWLIEVTDSIDEEDGRQVKARAMLLGSQAETEQIRAEAIVGNFTALAIEHSQHDSKNAGGDLGWLRPGDMDSTAFDEAAFSLTPGAVSEPVRDESVQTTGGYWIIEVIDRDDQRALEGQAREGIAYKELVDSFERWKEESAVENRLDTDKQSWAINEVLRRR